MPTVWINMIVYKWTRRKFEKICDGEIMIWLWNDRTVSHLRRFSAHDHLAPLQLTLLAPVVLDQLHVERSVGLLWSPTQRPARTSCRSVSRFKYCKMQERYNWRFKVSTPIDTLLQHSSYLQPSCNWPKHNRMKPSTSVGGLAGVRIFDGTHTVAAAGPSKSWGEDFPKWI